MNKIFKHFLTLSLLILFTLPSFVFAQGSGNNTGLTYECPSTYVNGVPVSGNCTFEDLVQAVINFINKVIPIALGLSVIAIAYAGFLYMKSGTSPGERGKANRALQYVAIGIFFMLAAWLIANMIANTLLNPNAGIPRII